jgi:poly-gamma-glutamate synthesis protein (capsule biosynthesis protein)
MPADSSTADLYDLVTGYVDEPRFWETVLARFVFEDGVLAVAELYPVTLGRELPRSRRGCPQLASPSDGRRILERLAELSAPFGATVGFDEHGVGRLAVGDANGG